MKTQDGEERTSTGYPTKEPRVGRGFLCDSDRRRVHEAPTHLDAGLTMCNSMNEAMPPKWQSIGPLGYGVHNVPT